MPGNFDGKIQNVGGYFNPKKAAREMREVSSDFIRTENQKVLSRWFHGKSEVDLFIWTDENKNIIKQQVSFAGHIIEWNIVDGVRTGLLIEQETEAGSKVAGSELIRFDQNPSATSIQHAVSLVVEMEQISDLEKRDLLENFSKSPSLDTMSSMEILDKYTYIQPKGRLMQWIMSFIRFGQKFRSKK